MQISSGIDIIEIKRIKKSIEELGENFISKIFTDNEIQYCESRKNMKYQHYAARFAGKEATFKAISKILDDKYSITWKDIEIIDDKNGRPIIYFLNKDYNEIQDIDISISHCQDYAIAVVNIILK